MQKNTQVAKTNIHFLKQGLNLLSHLTDEQFALNNGKFFKSGVGRHYRHVLEHYISLVEGYTLSKVNYDSRNRDLRMETDRSFAILKTREMMDAMETFVTKPILLDQNLEIKSNESTLTKDEAGSSSSVRRELQFLISHTVHHYALMAIILRTIDFEIEDDFGVAPSTLQYEQSKSNPLQDS